MPFQELDYAESNGEHHRKRKRKTYSCVDCRRRKLKCDREHPCGRCTKEGHPQSCAFNTDGNGSDMDDYDTPTKGSWEKDQFPKPSSALVRDKQAPTIAAARDPSFALEKKIAYLESRVAHFESSNRIQPITGQIRTASRPEIETRYFSGKGGFKSQFYGASNPTSTLIHV